MNLLTKLLQKPSYASIDSSGGLHINEADNSEERVEPLPLATSKRERARNSYGKPKGSADRRNQLNGLSRQYALMMNLSC